MNNKGNVMINFLFFTMVLAVTILFIPVIKDFVDMAQQSDFLNCKGYIYEGNANNSLSFNSTLNGGASGSPTACLALKLYLPYILLVILIAGVAKLLYDRSDPFAQDVGFTQ